jgi:hypothetical protein
LLGDYEYKKFLFLTTQEVAMLHLGGIECFSSPTVSSGKALGHWAKCILVVTLCIAALKGIQVWLF